MRANLGTFRSAVIGLAVAGFLFGASGTVAYANASSSENTWYCVASGSSFSDQAFTNNSSTPKGGSGTTKSKGGFCSGSVAAQIGAAAFLKKTNGVTCATASAVYGNQALLSRLVSYSSSACGGAGTQLQGTMTSYGYHNTGYLSDSIAAPFQTY